MGRDQQVVTGVPVIITAIGEGQYRFPFDHGHPLILVLIVPARVRRALAAGEDAFNGHSSLADQPLTQLAVELRRNIRQ